MATIYHDNVRDDKDGHNDSHGFIDPFWMYMRTFAVLMVLLFVTIGAYYFDFAKFNYHGHDLGWINTFIAMLIASTKTLIVVLVFMHLRHSTKLTWVVASAGFVWLCVMVLFTFADYLSRGAIRENVKMPLNDSATVTLMPEAGKPVNNAGWAENGEW